LILKIKLYEEVGVLCGQRRAPGALTKISC
jgi:hypothetical protein